MLEAFNYSAENDPYDEIPQYDDNGDGISQTDPVPAGGDGALGAETYLFEWIPADFDHNRCVDFGDYSLFASAWSSDPNKPHWDPLYDISEPNDSIIDMLDLRVFTESWLAGAGP